MAYKAPKECEHKYLVLSSKILITQKEIKHLPTLEICSKCHLERRTPQQTKPQQGETMYSLDAGKPIRDVLTRDGAQSVTTIYQQPSYVTSVYQPGVTYSAGRVFPDLHEMGYHNTKITNSQGPQ